MVAKKPQKPTVPPTMKPDHTIPLLNRQLERLKEIIALHHEDPKISAWQNTTENILNAAYGEPNGEPHNNTYEFVHASGGPIFMEMSDQEVQQHHINRHRKREELLKAYIEQLNDLSPPLNVPIEIKLFHIKVREVASKSVNENNFRAAIIDTFIALDNYIEEKSGQQLTGATLMQTVFSQKNPIFKLSEDGEEQAGLMMLFTGAIKAIRNQYTHSLVDPKSPQEAMEWLAFASALFRLVDYAKTNPIK